MAVVPTGKTTIFQKVDDFRLWTRNNHRVLTHREPKDSDVERHLVDWSRCIDNGHLWRFPPTGFCQYRLTEQEIKTYLPSAALLLEVWRRRADHRLIPGTKYSTATCDGATLIAYLSKHVFKPLSRLNPEQRPPLVPNDRYIAFKIWEIIPPGGSDLANYLVRSPKDIGDKLQQLYRYGENPYWAKSDVRRWPFAPPIVCVEDYQGHLWEKAFFPGETATFEQAYSQLDLLSELKAYHTKEFPGYWKGTRYSDIYDEWNSLSLVERLPPAVLFRADQDLTWSREATGFNKAVFSEVVGQFQVQTEGPGAALDPEWLAEQEELAKQRAQGAAPSQADSDGSFCTQKADSERSQSSELESEKSQSPKLEPDKSQIEAFPTQKTHSPEKSQSPEMEPGRSQGSGLTSPMATPVGSLIPVSEVKLEDVALNRPRRPVHNGTNAGERFKSKASQIRVFYEERLDWPLINAFPDHIHHDPTLKVTLEQFKAYCPAYTVLPDFWKHWALELGVDRAEAYKLDFNARGNLAKDFTPHGAAATGRDSDGTRKFVIWNGFQLHGDVGERLKLRRKLPTAEWKKLVKQTYPNVQATDIKEGKSYRCLGEVCPEEYQMPPDWDVLGVLPGSDTISNSMQTNLPSQEQAQHSPSNLLSSPSLFTPVNPAAGSFTPANLSTTSPFGSQPASPFDNQPAPQPWNPVSTSFTPVHLGSQHAKRRRLQDQSSTSILGPSIAGPIEPKKELISGLSRGPTPDPGRGTTGPELLFPKAWGKSPLSSHAQLLAENTGLKTRLKFADAKVRALTVLASKNDHALWLLGEKFGSVMEDCAPITSGIDQAVENLRDEFPSLEALITEHKDRGGLRQTMNMANWILQDDHIQMELELGLRQSRDSGA